MNLNNIIIAAVIGGNVIFMSLKILSNVGPMTTAKTMTAPMQMVKSTADRSRPYDVSAERSRFFHIRSISQGLGHGPRCLAHFNKADPER